MVSWPRFEFCLFAGYLGDPDQVTSPFKTPISSFDSGGIDTISVDIRNEKSASQFLDLGNCFFSATIVTDNHTPVYLCLCVCVCVCIFVCSCLVTQSCPTLCDFMDCSPPGSSVHRIFQARILEWVAISSSRESSRPRDWTCVSCVSCLGKRVLYQLSHWENHIYVCVYMHDTEDLKIYQFPLFLLISFVSLHLWHFSLSAGRGFAAVDSIIPCCRWY